eukprot:s707_g6.t1
MRCKRRILLSGTPLQNNLDEFYTCCQFVHPSMLPASSVFQRASQYGEGVHLQLLMMLRQLCNDPQGLRANLERRVGANRGAEAQKASAPLPRPPGGSKK